MTTPATGASNALSGSLYVGDLSPDIAEGQLFEIFNQVGPVASIRVCRDAITRRSLGYAYINFHSSSDAERALDTLNNTPIKGKPCRIMWCQRDPSIRRSGVGNIFIKNLDKTIDHKALYDTFSRFGNILSCKVVTDDQHNSKGYGFVHYETNEMSEKAISKVNGMMLNGKKVYVGPFIPKKERQSNGEGAKFTNVYVKNLPESFDTEKLREICNAIGPVSSAVVMTDKDGKSRGFGFVNFENAEDAMRSVEELHGQEFEGKMVYVGRAQKKAERQAELRKKFEAMKQERLKKYEGVNLYVKNLGDDVDEEKLRTEFAAYGSITSVAVMRDEKGNSKGFGFVCFSSPDEATRCIAELNGKMLGNKPLYVALAQRKDQRRAHLEAQYAAKQKRGGPAGNGVPGQPGAPLAYPAGAPPVFFPQAGQLPPTGYVYPHMVAPRGARWTPQQQQYGGQPMQNYMAMPMRQQRGGRGGGRRGGGYTGGRGGARGPGGPDPAVVQAHQQAQAQAHAQAQAQAAQAQQAATGAAPLPANASLTSEMLATYTLEQQGVILGERLYPLIAKSQPELAGKITGMLLDRYNQPGATELLNLLENNEALNEKIDVALKVLQQHAAGGDGPASGEQAAASSATAPDAAPAATATEASS